MKIQLTLLGGTLLLFSAYTAAVVSGHGYLGFLELAWRDSWGGQMLVDLVIALTLFVEWMRRDAREQNIAMWPYLALLLTTGSIGALAYLVHRTARQLRATSLEGRASA